MGLGHSVSTKEGMSQMDKTASQIMSKKLITVRYDDSVRKAYQLMQDKKIRHLPVSDERGAVIGILSDRDLQKAMRPQQDVEFDDALLVKDFMSWPVRTIAKSVSVEHVTTRMLNEKVSALLVVDHAHGAAGIITTDDLLKLLLTLLQKEPGWLQMSLDSAIERFGFSSANLS
jgi:acetoin utilization protein AcuB